MTDWGDLRERDRAILRERAIREARRSLRGFSNYVYQLEPAPHHQLVVEALEAVEAGIIKRLVIIAPPGHAKSTYVSIEFPAWAIGRKPSRKLIAITTTATLADLYGDSVRATIDSTEAWPELFPDVRPDVERGWSRDGAFVTGWKRNPSDKDPNLTYTGAGGPVIGRRADGLIVDDVVDEEVARSETQLETRLTWLRRTLRTRLKPGGFVVIAGTLWTDGDVVDTYSRTAGYTVIKMRALSLQGETVTARVTVPEGVDWRPSLPWRYVEPEVE